MANWPLTPCATILTSLVVTARTYPHRCDCTPLTLYLAYALAFPQFPWGFNDLDCTENAPYQDDWFIILGIQNYCGQFFSPYIISELLILLSTFTQRTVLIEFGMWNDAVATTDDKPSDGAAAVEPGQAANPALDPAPSSSVIVLADPSTAQSVCARALTSFVTAGFSVTYRAMPWLCVKSGCHRGHRRPAHA